MTPSRLDGVFKIHYFFLCNKYVHVLFVVRTSPMTFFTSYFDMGWGIMHIFENQKIVRIPLVFLRKKKKGPGMFDFRKQSNLSI